MSLSFSHMLATQSSFPPTYCLSSTCLEENVTLSLCRICAPGAVTAATEDGLTVIPSIAIPGVCGVEEVEYLCRVFCQASKDFLEESGILTKINFAFGAVVETPRACLQAERLAKCGFVDFIWFDTNSLTELMFGTSPLDQHQFAVRGAGRLNERSNFASPSFLYLSQAVLHSNGCLS